MPLLATLRRQIFWTRDSRCQETVSAFYVGYLALQVLPLPHSYRTPFNPVALRGDLMLAPEVDIGWR